MRSLAALPLAALAAGCQLTNETVLVSTLVQSPAPPVALGVGSAQITTAQVYLGRTKASNPSAADVTPVSGASVQLLEDGSPIATLSESQPGYYQATGTFYQANHTFRVVATLGSDQYWGEVANVPPAPTMTLPGTPDPGTGLYLYASYANVPDPYDVGRGTCSVSTPICNIGFYGVWTASSGSTFDPNSAPNCTNAPRSGGELLNLAYFDDTPWRVNPFHAPKATCFPPPGYPDGYLVGLTDLKKGTVSGNLSIASLALAGASAAAGVTVSGP